MKKNIIKKIIDNSFENNKISHSYLFSSIGNSEAAEYLIKKIVNTTGSIKNHSNIFLLDPKEQKLKKEVMQEYIKKFSQHSNFNRVLYIKNVDNSSKQTLNSLLKFIEEPTDGVFIVMTTKNYLRVLPTIVSRSQLFQDFQWENLVSFSEHELDLLFERVFNSKSEFEKYEKKDLINYISSLIKTLEKSVSNKDFLYCALEKMINKDNIEIIIKFLIEFFNDIWRKEKEIPLSYNNFFSTIKLYKDINFNYIKALNVLHSTLNQNIKLLNFKLLKTNFLIELGEIYE